MEMPTLRKRNIERYSLEVFKPKFPYQNAGTEFFIQTSFSKVLQYPEQNERHTFKDHNARFALKYHKSFMLIC